MSVVHLIDTVTDWTRANICTQIQLKQPPDDLDAPTDAGYEYTLVTPAAFSMYMPTSEKLFPPVKSPYPSVCVRILSGEDALNGTGGFADLQLCFSTWDTGLHGEDILRPNGQGGVKRWTGEEADAYFRRFADGWRDAWNFVDIALRKLEGVSSIGGFVIDRTVPIKYGPMTDQESIPDFYPNWYAWVTFRVKYPLFRNNPDIENLL